ncbi:hypothetical protein [Rhodococcus sp. USK10]|uniref:hypothetical protein n=1 Tax=Rhodococcus sp. USK10 TaxID=2789739 RepID=UPI002150E7D7|nr:hypothetical protein [Rhodococcus sp. USK10]
MELVPVISGNSLRGVLRRIAEGMLRDVLDYEGQLPLAVAHALPNGGAIVKTQAEPITGRRLHQLRELVPLLSVFGGAIGAAPIDGCLRVGDVVPVSPKRPQSFAEATRGSRFRPGSTSKPSSPTPTSTM